MFGQIIAIVYRPTFLVPVQMDVKLIWIDCIIWRLCGRRRDTIVITEGAMLVMTLRELDYDLVAQIGPMSNLYIIDT